MTKDSSETMKIAIIASGFDLSAFNSVPDYTPHDLHAMLLSLGIYNTHREYNECPLTGAHQVIDIPVSDNQTLRFRFTLDGKFIEKFLMDN